MNNNSVLPRYKSSEFDFTFKFEDCEISRDSKEKIEWFKKRRELNSDTMIHIISGDRGFNHPVKHVVWWRKTRQGREKIHLGKIMPTEAFLEFLDRFFEKRGIRRRHWKIPYGFLLAVCRACEKDEESFHAMVRKAKNTKEFKVLSGVR